MVQKLDLENTSSTAADLQVWFGLQFIQKSTKHATGILVFPHCALAEPISTFNLMAKKYRRQIVQKTKTVSAHNIVISFELVANVVISSAQYRRETWKSTLIELTPAGNCLVGALRSHQRWKSDWTRTGKRRLDWHQREPQTVSKSFSSGWMGDGRDWMDTP